MPIGLNQLTLDFAKEGISVQEAVRLGWKSDYEGLVFIKGVITCDDQIGERNSVAEVVDGKLGPIYGNILRLGTEEILRVGDSVDKAFAALGRESTNASVSKHACRQFTNDFVLHKEDGLALRVSLFQGRVSHISFGRIGSLV